MNRIASVSLVLALAMLRAAGAADTAKTKEEFSTVAEEQPKREARMAANSNSLETLLPQLSANTGAVPEVPMASETSPTARHKAAPVTVTTPPAAQSRNIWAVALAILVLLAGRFVLKHLRSRTRPS